MNNKEYIIAIDQSTSGTKALLFDREGKLAARTNASHKQIYPKPGWVEHDPEEIAVNTLDVIETLIEQTGTEYGQVSAIGVSNQRETVLIWDRNTGKPVHNAVVWQCSRAAEICSKIEQTGTAGMIKDSTGLVLSPYFPAAKLKWLLDNVDGVKARAEKGELVFGTIDSWLLWNLTGGTCHCTDFSNASRTQLFNIEKKCWDEEVFRIFGIPVEMAPEVKDSSHIFGYTDIRGKSEKKIPVASLIGDSHAALFGQNCFETGMTKTTYGTGSSIMMNIGENPASSGNGTVTSIGWSINGKVEYVFEGNINHSADTIKWMVDNLELLPDSAASESLARSVSGTDGVYIVPAFTGLGAPYWDSDAKAVISGITRGTGKAHIVRAGLDSVAYQIRDVIDSMLLDSGTELKELRVDGGATANSYLMQFQSDQLNVPVVCAAIEELSAMGAAYMAGLATGFWKDKNEIAGLRAVGKTYCPGMPKEQREALYRGWKEAVSKVLTKPL